MSDKRTRAREWKQQKVKRKKMLVAGFIAVILLAAAAFGVYGMDVYNKSYVMVFEGERINKADFVFIYLNSMNTMDDPKEIATDQLLETLVLIHRGKTDGLALTEEETGEMLEWAVSFKSGMEQAGRDASFITDKRLSEILSTEIYYRDLMEKYTADMNIDEADFERALNDFKENNKTEYIDGTYKFAFSESREEVEEGLNEVHQGNMTFDELTEKLTGELYTPDVTIQATQLSQLGLEDENDINKIMALTEGEISDIFVIDEFFLVIKAESVEVPSDEEIRDAFRERYELDKKREFFTTFVEQWKAEANYTINQRAIDAI